MRPRAFEIVSAARCIDAVEQQNPPEPGRALPITAQTWQQLYSGRLPATTSPWWMNIQNHCRQATAQLWVPTDLPCFAGHFPDQPILPGVMQLDWAIQLANNLWPNETQISHFAGCARLKFKAPVLPNSLLTLALELNSDESHKQPPTIAFALRSATQTLTTARLLYRD